MKSRNSFRSDQRGAVAFEAPFVYLFLILLILMPMADLAACSFQYISAYEALRNLGAYAQYHPPPDVTKQWTFPSAGYTIAAAVNCGDTNTACTPANQGTPMYYTFSTTIEIAPLVPLTKSVLCVSGARDPCSYTLTFMERFK